MNRKLETQIESYLGTVLEKDLDEDQIRLLEAKVTTIRKIAPDDNPEQ